MRVRKTNGTDPGTSPDHGEGEVIRAPELAEIPVIVTQHQEMAELKQNVDPDLVLQEVGYGGALATGINQLEATDDVLAAAAEYKAARLYLAHRLWRLSHVTARLQTMEQRWAHFCSDLQARITAAGHQGADSDVTRGRYLRQVTRLARPLEARWLLAALLIATVTSGFVLDSSAFEVLRLSGGQAVTDLFAGAVATLVAAGSAAAGKSLWWFAEPSAREDAGSRRRLLWLLVLPPALLGTAVAVVSIRVAELHRLHIAAPVVPLGIINCVLVAVDVLIALAAFQPLADEDEALREEIEQAEADLEEARDEVEQAERDAVELEAKLAAIVAKVQVKAQVLLAHTGRQEVRVQQMQTGDRAGGSGTHAPTGGRVARNEDPAPDADQLQLTDFAVRFLRSVPEPLCVDTGEVITGPPGQPPSPGPAEPEQPVPGAARASAPFDPSAATPGPSTESATSNGCA